MRTVLNQKHIAQIIEDYVNRDGGDFSYILFSKFEDGTIGAVVTHDYEFDLPSNWCPPDGDVK